MATLSSATTTTTPSQATNRLFAHMAVAAGLSASALYLAQPLLHRLAAEFALSPGQASWLVTGGQLGYAVGLLLLVPLGDIVRPRRLATVLLLLTAAGMITASLAVSAPMLIAATVATSMFAVGAQVLVPMSAAIAATGHSGRAVGTVMAGVLFGGLAGRAVSGVLADVAGWRSGYWVIAAALIVATVTLRPRLPLPAAPTTPVSAGGYLSMLRSLALPLRELPGLRRRTLVAALAMASFAIQLVALTLQLSSATFRWNATAIGLFSLIAVVGVALMPLTGRLADAGHARTLITVGLSLEVLAWAVLLLLGTTIVGVTIGVVVLIVGQQAVLAASQSIVYALRPEARSRINAIFMTVCFLGGSAGSALAGFAWTLAGWPGACVVALTLAALGLLAQLVTRGR